MSGWGDIVVMIFDRWNLLVHYCYNLYFIIDLKTVNFFIFVQFSIYISYYTPVTPDS